MFTSLITVVCSTGVVFAVANESPGCWNVDKSTVMHGGCITIIVAKPCNESRNLSLQIDDRQPVNLFDGVGPDYHRRNSRLPGREATLVLLYYDMHNPEGMQEIPGQPGRFQLVPVFNRPGNVRLTLYDGEQSLGTRNVTVLPCLSDARAALALLNASLPGKKGAPRDEFLWTSLIAHQSPDLTPPVTERELQLVRDQLPMMMQHPDWAEIAEMRLAKLEAGVEYRRASELVQSRGLGTPQSVAHRSVPQVLTEALRKQPQSPFAQALQDDARDLAGSRTVLIRQPDARQDNE